MEMIFLLAKRPSRRFSTVLPRPLILLGFDKACLNEAFSIKGLFEPDQFSITAPAVLWVAVSTNTIEPSTRDRT
jgi:hypothetical protein